MSVDEFWHSTDTEIHAFEKAYLKRIDQQAWLQGYYNYQAQASVLSGVFAKKKSDIYEYPKQPLSLLRSEKEADISMNNQSEEDKDKEFRDILMECY